MKATILIVCLSLLLTACGATPATPTPIVIPVTIPVESPTATPEPAAPAPTTVTLIADLTESRTYANDLLGFQFDYPVAWGISALPEMAYAAITIYSWDPNARPPKQQEGIPEGGEKMDVIPMEGVTFEQAIEQLRASAAEPLSRPIASEEAVTLPSGAPGLLIRYESVPDDVEAIALLTEVNGEVIALYGVGWQLDYFLAIAYTLRPAGE